MQDISTHWGAGHWPLIEGDPFEAARSSCLRAETVAGDVFIDEAALERFVSSLDATAVQEVMKGSMGENCDTTPEEFENGEDAVNFAVLFSLLQFGHGFRYELHRHCGRGASKTITLGVRNLRSGSDLSAARLRSVTGKDVREAFLLPEEPSLEELAEQLLTVMRETAGLWSADPEKPNCGPWPSWRANESPPPPAKGSHRLSWVTTCGRAEKNREYASSRGITRRIRFSIERNRGGCSCPGSYQSTSWNDHRM